MKKTTKFTRKWSDVFWIILPILMLCTLGCSGDDDQNQIKEQDLTYLEGNYVGTWNSTTSSIVYVDYPISARVLSSSNNKLTGTMFFTSNFEVCCSDAAYDGTYAMKVEDTEIKTFRLDGVQRDCFGVFTGIGILREIDNAIVIDISGNDCDGTHLGQIILIKE